MKSDALHHELVRAPAPNAVETLRTQRYFASDPSFWHAIRPSWRVDAQHDPSPPPYVRWAVVKRHAVPKVVTAGIAPSKVDWVQVSEALSRHDDPTLSADTATDEQDDSAACAPRN